MPGLAAVVSSRTRLLRPAMMTWFPSFVKALGKAAANAHAASRNQNGVSLAAHG